VVNEGEHVGIVLDSTQTSSITGTLLATLAHLHRYGSPEVHNGESFCQNKKEKEPEFRLPQNQSN
jgi:hypothetical protein